jgi:hypothetical protein
MWRIRTTPVSTVKPGATNRWVAASLGILMLQSSAAAIASPWPQPYGQGFLITTLNVIEVRKAAGNVTPAHDAAALSLQSVGAYAEYGWAPAITVGTSFRLEHVRLNADPGHSTSNGVSDVELFARRVLWQSGSAILAAQGTLVVPTGYNPNANPALGDGAFGLEPRLLFGHGFTIGAWPAFFDLQGAYRARFGDLTDQVRVDGTLGLHPSTRWLLLLQIYDTLSLRSERHLEHDYDICTVSASATRELGPHRSVHFGLTRLIATRGYGNGTGLSAGMWWRF